MNVPSLYVQIIPSSNIQMDHLITDDFYCVTTNTASFGCVSSKNNCRQRVAHLGKKKKKITVINAGVIGKFIRTQLLQD